MTYDASTGVVTDYELRAVAADMTPRAGDTGQSPMPGPDEDWSGADDLGWAGSGGGVGTGDGGSGFPWIRAVLAGVVVVAYAVGGTDD